MTTTRDYLIDIYLGPDATPMSQPILISARSPEEAESSRDVLHPPYVQGAKNVPGARMGSARLPTDGERRWCISQGLAYRA